MPPSWTLADLTELDLRLARGVPDEVSPVEGMPSAPSAIRAWLSECRAADPGPWQAAHAMVRGERILRWIFRALSLLSGAVAAAGLLHYDGKAPINVAFYLAVLVGGQLLLLLVFFLLRLLRRLGLAEAGHSWMIGLFLRLRRRFLPHGFPEITAPLPSSASFWSLRAFASLQSAGLFFNVGVLAATFALVGFQDLGFGWATTLDLPPEPVHRVVGLLAAPWRGAWTPTLEQIAASRIRRGQAEFPVHDPQALASWWPFLVGCVCVYGALPRLLLALGAEGRLAWRLRHEIPQGAAAQRLHLRLTRAPLAMVADESDGPLPRFEPPLASAVEAQGPLRLELPNELDGPETRSALALLAGKRFGVQVETAGDAVPAGGMLLVREAWRPPLEEDLAALRAWRNRVGHATDLFVWCVGFPRGQTPGTFDAPDPMDLGVWRESLARLRDPRLWIVPWEDAR